MRSESKRKEGQSISVDTFCVRNMSSVSNSSRSSSFARQAEPLVREFAQDEDNNYWQLWDYYGKHIINR